VRPFSYRWVFTYKHPNTSTAFRIYRETLSRFSCAATGVEERLRYPIVRSFPYLRAAGRACRSQPP
ncbi:hypothetical protein ABLN72_09440, partial [Mycobacterium tuberculosis]